jgi:hypothetical protein
MLCDDSTKVLVIKIVTMGGEGVKNFKFCVTSFMNDALLHFSQYTFFKTESQFQFQFELQNNLHTVGVRFDVHGQERDFDPISSRDPVHNQPMF